MAVVFKKPSTLTDAPLHYCPGCTHGIIHRLVAEAIEELGIDGKTVGVASVGCSVMCYDYFTCDMVQAPHGRAQAVATGIKRAKPEDVVFTYQGDGDLAAIGTAETVHAATRGENITVIFAMKKAFQNQIEGKGYSIVEVLSTCPTNWGMSPVEALDWLEKNMVPYYPLGVYKDGTKGDRLK